MVYRFERFLLCCSMVFLLSCKGQVGEGLPGPGEACGDDEPCSVGFCHGPKGRAYCTAPCASDGECTQGFICAPDVALQANLCMPGSRCGGDENCPSGHRCDPSSGSCFISVQRDLCGPCTSLNQCPEDGLCVLVKSTGERFCSGPCELQRDCPQGYGCRSISQDGVSYDGVSKPRQCIPLADTCNARRSLCSPCDGDWECGSQQDLCLENRLTHETFCGAFCSPTCVYDEAKASYVDSVTGRSCDGACPASFSCLDVGGLHQCVPDSLGCAGYCDAANAFEERRQCGPGMACDRASRRCVEARDGRTCAPCVDDESCAGSDHVQSTCLVNHDNGQRFCAASCDSNSDCLGALGVGFSCLEVEGRSLCVPDSGSCSVGMQPLGAACLAAGDCAGGLCLRYGEKGMCSGSCLEDSDCGDARWACCAMDGSGKGYDCEEELGEGGGACIPRGGAFGDVCDPGRPPCEEGYCLHIGTARVCTADCDVDADCDEASRQSGAFRCSEARVEGGSTSDRVKVCFPSGGGELGSDCSFGPAACKDPICLKMRIGNRCSKLCDEDDPCPPGWKCDEAPTVDGLEFRICLPDGGT